MVLMSWLVTTGCNRSYYRRQADCDARMLIVEKLNDPRWSDIDPTIEIQPDSRMYDQFSADNPPMPNDDFASHAFMHSVDGKPGYQYWHVNGDTTYVANPEWRAYLPLDENGVLQLDLDRAVQLSLIHSPNLQTQRENLYELALTVSLQRFGFDLQAFSGWGSFFRTGGRNSGQSVRNDNGTPFDPSDDFNQGSSSVSIGTPGGGRAGRTQLTKLGINGANFVVGLANSVIWSFGGDNTQTGSSLIDFTLIQPLLRGAARQVVMEGLTQAERNLLAGVRQLERFRRGFYLSIVTGGNAGPGPSANSASYLSQPPTASFGASGFIGLLQTRQEIRIQEFNVQSLENVLAQFQELVNEERIPLLQLRQVETSLYNAQRSLLALRVQFQNQQDTFKRSLGLPPDLVIEIDDPFLDQFELIDDLLLERQLSSTLFREEIGELLLGISPGSSNDGIQEIEWSDEFQLSLEALLPAFDALSNFFDQLEGPDRELLLKDFDRLESVTARRQTELGDLRAKVESGDAIYDIEPSILQDDSIVAAEQLRAELTALEKRLVELRASAEEIREAVIALTNEGASLTSAQIAERVNQQIIFDAPEVVTQLSDAVIEMTLLQARARTNSISLPPVELGSATAWTIACQFRRDLMNARAALVDQWRQIEIGADDLESVLDVVVEGSVGTIGGGGNSNPFALNWTTNQFGMGFQFDAPITRLAERNAYREILINYQRARRNFYNFEDQIKQNLRQTLRVIDQSKVLFELNRRSIGVAVEQVELARFDLIEPNRPGTQPTFNSTLAINLINSLNSLQNAQNSFLQVWVQYEVARRGLDFDLGTMQLTPQGEWLDPGIINAQYAFRAAEAYGIPADSICLPPDISYLMPESGESVLEEAVDIEVEAGEEPAPGPSLDTPAESTEPDSNDQADAKGIFGGALRRAGLIR